jgi:hypothetical protein
VALASKPQPLKRDFRGAPVETKTFQEDGEDSVGSNPAKNELDQIANRELSGVIAQHRINLLNDLGLASHGL